jgi:hypothetical protein
MEDECWEVGGGEEGGRGNGKGREADWGRKGIGSGVVGAGVGVGFRAGGAGGCRGEGGVVCSVQNFAAEAGRSTCSNSSCPTFHGRKP